MTPLPQLLQRSTDTTTRGNCIKLLKPRPKLDVSKYSFSYGVANLWNSLPNSVVSFHCINSVDKKLDAHWAEENACFDYHAQITGS